ncbi:hypothetical protein [Clostridium sp. Cult3]|uniref:hypothetical protein n=1 Tax=Clostridium sp. Cult3 TaxID=2079004 RepID=UPI001F296CCF|nr:hypothetical protein [Clostridium sp. Cult3]MCF6461636.1 hypothetical protein [Clostridium sp. Cult3]
MTRERAFFVKGINLFRILISILIIVTIICSIKLEQKRLDTNEYKKFHDRFKRDEYIDSVVHLYTPFDFLGIVIVIFSIYSMWSFLLYRNIDGRLYKLILALIFDFAAIMKVYSGYQWISYAKISVINEGLIIQTILIIKPYLFAFAFLGTGKLFKQSIEKEYQKEVKKVRASEYGQKWIAFNDKLAKK